MFLKTKTNRVISSQFLTKLVIKYWYTSLRFVCCVCFIPFKNQYSKCKVKMKLQRHVYVGSSIMVMP